MNNESLDSYKPKRGASAKDKQPAAIEPPRRKPFPKQVQDGEIAAIEMTRSCARDLTDRIKASAMSPRCFTERMKAEHGSRSDIRRGRNTAKRNLRCRRRDRTSCSISSRSSKRSKSPQLWTPRRMRVRRVRSNQFLLTSGPKSGRKR